MKSRETDTNDRERTGGRLLIIGYGNPLRSDDGLGWMIAKELAKRIGESATVLTVHQLTPELAEAISEADLVIFIDACYEGAPGSWQCETIQGALAPSQIFAHHLTPATLLIYARAVLNAEPAALLVSVAGGSFEYGQHLSPNVAEIVPEIVSTVYEWWRASTGTLENPTSSCAAVPSSPRGTQKPRRTGGTRLAPRATQG
jgi:hydrogenase maturation protease